MTNKMTNRKALTYIVENFDLPEDVLAKVQTMIEALDHKTTTGTRKLTPRQIENRAIADNLTRYLKETGKAMTCTEMVNDIPEIAEMADVTNQRISAICRPLVEAHVLEKETVKGKTYFHYAETETEGN